MSTSAVPPFGYGTSSSDASSPDDAILSVHVAQSVAGRTSVAVMTTATCEPLSVKDIFGWQEPSVGEDTVAAFGFVTFGSSDGFDGENEGAPPMLIAEMISFSSELRMCVAFPLPFFAVILRLVGFDVPPELDDDPPELDPPDELPPELELVVPPHSSSNDSADRSFSQDEASIHARSLAVDHFRRTTSTPASRRRAALRRTRACPRTSKCRWTRRRENRWRPKRRSTTSIPRLATLPPSSWWSCTRARRR